MQSIEAIFLAPAENFLLDVVQPMSLSVTSQNSEVIFLISMTSATATPKPMLADVFPLSNSSRFASKLTKELNPVRLRGKIP